MGAWHLTSGIPPLLLRAAVGELSQLSRAWHRIGDDRQVVMGDWHRISTG